MLLMKPKEDIARDARFAAQAAIKNHSLVGHNQPYGSVLHQLTELIALAVEAGVAEMLKNMYTNDEFERDVGLDKA